MEKRTRGKLADRVIQVIIGVVVILIAGFLVSGSQEYSTIKDNSEKVPGLVQDNKYFKSKWDCHDSTETVRYIMDTIKQNEIYRKTIENSRELREIKQSLKK